MTTIQCVFTEKKKGTKTYKANYFKKVNDLKAEKITESEFMLLVDNSKVARPIYKDLI